MTTQDVSLVRSQLEPRRRILYGSKRSVYRAHTARTSTAPEINFVYAHLNALILHTERQHTPRADQNESPNESAA